MKQQLSAIAEDVWGAETEIAIGLGMKLPLRMTVLRDRAGLTLISPIEINGALQRELLEEGPVHTLIGPNRLHYRYLEQAKKLFPHAQLLGAPGLAEKCPHLDFDATLSSGELSAKLSSHLIRGAETLSEVAFFHQPSGTLVVTDLVFNIHQANTPTKWLLQLLSRAYGKVEQSRLCRTMTSDRKATAQDIDQLLSLPFERVVPAHGEVFETRARQELSAGLWWMRGQSRRPTV